MSTPSLSSIDMQAFLQRADRVLQQLEAWLPPPSPTPNWDSLAYQWRKQHQTGWLAPIQHTAIIPLDALHHIDDQKERIVQNTRQFLEGHLANHVLMTGSRGTGKSSVVKSLLHAFADQGLRMIEMDKADIVDLPQVMDLVANRPEKFIIFCDDLSFEEGESAYKTLKSVLDGSLAGGANNVLIYATSNRKHLMPQRMQENLDAVTTSDGEIRPGETTEEKVSLSERFGLWVGFYPFNQDDYLSIVEFWLNHLGYSSFDRAATHTAALQWSIHRGSRSGRVAWHFAKDWAGRFATGAL